MLHAKITRTPQADGKEAIALVLSAEGTVVVHDCIWRCSNGGADHVAQELEAALRRIGVELIEVG